mmetsp:Transcript_16628/g.33103  ORF Transcript_16628/g.33103 Transcript_16628/m.33103 type:complete len:208 (-) Transcript_16628:734-1357(-)
MPRLIPDARPLPDLPRDALRERHHADHHESGLRQTHFDPVAGLADRDWQTGLHRHRADREREDGELPAAGLPPVPGEARGGGPLAGPRGTHGGTRARRTGGARGTRLRTVRPAARPADAAGARAHARTGVPDRGRGEKVWVVHRRAVHVSLWRGAEGPADQSAPAGDGGDHRDAGKAERSVGDGQGGSLRSRISGPGRGGQDAGYGI